MLYYGMADKILKFFLGDDYETRLKKVQVELVHEEVNPTLEDLKATYPNLEEKVLKLSKNSLNEAIKWGSSRYNDRKSWVLDSILKAIDEGKPIYKRFSTGSAVEKHGLGGWSYTLLIDEEGNAWLFDPTIKKTFWKLTKDKRC